jgi:hypothetical protein
MAKTPQRGPRHHDEIIATFQRIVLYLDENDEVEGSITLPNWAWRYIAERLNELKRKETHRPKASRSQQSRDELLIWRARNLRADLKAQGVRKGEALTKAAEQLQAKFKRHRPIGLDWAKKLIAKQKVGAKRR